MHVQFTFLSFRLSLSASCLHSMHFDGIVGWKPDCEIDGTYLAKQCRGDKVTGRFVFRHRIAQPFHFLIRNSTFSCFCFTETGERTYGWDWWRNADDMSCACSRQRHRAEVKGRLDVTLRCLPNGNFEELQCDMGICWCADEIDGHILKGTFAVPETLWTYLPCCKMGSNVMQSFTKSICYF